MTKRVVVPFERPAAYWKARARRHDTPDHRPAAVKLLRKALEKTGDPATALELARVYLDMDCVTAAERYLVRAVARGGLSGSACYLMGRCALSRGDDALAEEAFDACQRLYPDGACADLAQDLLESMPWQPPQPRVRGRARSE
ncbi:MAG: tetratricopeptide repeat protein, partial [Clostridia bacterium]|nr:tetratricopeptide repeat protein [Clostridia bacterium]